MIFEYLAADGYVVGMRWCGGLDVVEGPHGAVATTGFRAPFVWGGGLKGWMKATFFSRGYQLQDQAVAAILKVKC